MSDRAEIGHMNDDEPDLQTLWRVVMGYYDRRTNERVPGILEKVNEISAYIKSRDPWLKCAVGCLALVALRAIGVPTQVIVQGVASMFGIHIPQ